MWHHEEGKGWEQRHMFILPVPQSHQHLCYITHTKRWDLTPRQVTEPLFCGVHLALCGVSSPRGGRGCLQTGAQQWTSVGWTARLHICCLECGSLSFPLSLVNAMVQRYHQHVLLSLCSDLYTFPWLRLELPIWDISVKLVPFCSFPCCIWEEGTMAPSWSRTREKAQLSHSEPHVEN